MPRADTIPERVTGSIKPDAMKNYGENECWIVEVWTHGRANRIEFMGPDAGDLAYSFAGLDRE